MKQTAKKFLAIALCLAMLASLHVATIVSADDTVGSEAVSALITAWGKLGKETSETIAFPSESGNPIAELPEELNFSDEQKAMFGDNFYVLNSTNKVANNFRNATGIEYIDDYHKIEFSTYLASGYVKIVTEVQVANKDTGEWAGGMCKHNWNAADQGYNTYDITDLTFGDFSMQKIRDKELKLYGAKYEIIECDEDATLYLGSVLGYKYEYETNIPDASTMTVEELYEQAKSLDLTAYDTGVDEFEAALSAFSVDEESVKTDAVDGTISVDNAFAKAGETVTTTITAPDNKQLKAGSLKYTLDGVTYYPITTRVGTDESVSNVFAFVMPEGNVTIVAEYVDANEPNHALLGAAYSIENGEAGKDMRFGSRAYRKAGERELVSCGNYLLRKDSALGSELTDGVALTEEQKTELTDPSEGQLVKRIPTSVLNDRCDDYVDYTVRIVGVANGYADRDYVCISYANYCDAEGNVTTVYSAPCIRNYNQLINAAQ